MPVLRREGRKRKGGKEREMERESALA